MMEEGVLCARLLDARQKGNGKLKIEYIKHIKGDIFYEHNKRL